ncbi:MAG: lysine--tRNA ligase [Minisyncoccia bacterium]
MLSDLIRDRIQKLELYKKYSNPYPSVVKRTAVIGDVLANFKKYLKNKKTFFLVGRVWNIRDQGKIMFVDVSDATGKIQFILKKENIKNFDLIKKTLVSGDFVEGKGKVFLTKSAEKSFMVNSIRIIVKSIKPIPNQWYGLEEQEERLRKRYLDILLHPEVKDLFIKKAIFWDSIRNFLKQQGFLEVENPIFELTPGGAEAEPFITHHNALNQDFYMRISLELPLKKLLVAGYEKVFEIGRIFRNEGIDREHLQDYTQMEFYWAYANYDDVMKMVQKMYQQTIKKIFGSLKTKFNNQTINWSGKWPKLDYYTLFKKETGINLSNTTKEELFKKAKSLNLDVNLNMGKGRIIDLIYKKTVRPKLIQPSFLIDPPVEMEPLAKRLDQDENRVARFQIMAGGSELGKGFSELNDPIDQRKRFEEQMRLRKAGDKEAQMLDEDFIEALEYGMPPAGGFGMSERLFAVLMNKSVRETVISPLMKNK